MTIANESAGKLEKYYAQSDRRAGESQIIWVLWLTYGAFYFCRTNISAAVPGLKESIDSGGLAMTPTEVGWILAASKFSYGIGQFANGLIAEQFSPRRLLAIGMLVSAALNVLFGMSTGFYFLLFVWACNGYFQSLGWPPCMRVVASWIPVLRRGRGIGIIGTGYQVTQALTFVIAGYSAKWLGWRGALYVPAGLLVTTALVMWLFLEDAPPQKTVDEGPTIPDLPEKRESSRTALENLLLTLSNPALWYLGVSLGLLNACRYGFLDWGLTHLKETQSTDIGDAALKYAVLPVGAVLGSYGAGWATDRFFGSRRAPVICVLLLMLGTLTVVYDTVVRSGSAATLTILLAIGFCIYGPQVLLVGTAPTDLARRGTSAAAAGFVNFMGYMGAAAGDIVTGKMLKIGWQSAIHTWAAAAFVSAIAAGLLWNATASHTKSPK